MTRRDVGRWTLAGFLGAAGTMHLLMPTPFFAQVPAWMPAPAAIIAVSGVVELVLAAALITAVAHRHLVGWIVAGYFVVILPGNVSQAVTGQDAFGLTSDVARWVRVAVQPAFVLWAMWCTHAWRTRASARSGARTR
ncbi:MAG: hypothetical protein WD377_08410 [Nitriliruptoraceae bacterium]